MNLNKKGMGALLTMIALASSCSNTPTNGHSRKVASIETSSNSSLVMKGPYTMAPKYLKHYYNSVPAARFGTFEISDKMLPQSTTIREHHYDLGQNQVGVRLIPVYDRKSDATSFEKNYPNDAIGKTANGKEVRGSEELDKILMKEFNYSDSEKNLPLFAILSYFHPENYKLSIKQLGEPSYLKTEMGITHTGAYIGRGQTRNSPYNYHDMGWWSREDNDENPISQEERGGYPIMVHTISFADVPQKIFNLNSYITLRLLNEASGAVEFPDNYKFDYFHSINMKESFAHYRAWLDHTWIRQDDDIYKKQPYIKFLQKKNHFATYCAEHITHVLNVSANLPQNLQGYQESFGEVEGEKLWKLAQKRWAKIDDGKDIPTVSYFKPLWQRKADNGLPYYKKVKNDKQDFGSVIHGTKVGKSMIFPPVSTSELIKSFSQTYMNWKDVGPVISSLSLVSFLQESSKRTGIRPMKFVEVAGPIMGKIVAYDLLRRPIYEFEPRLKGYIGAIKAKLSASLPAPLLQLIISYIKTEVSKKEAHIKSSNTPRDTEFAYKLFKDAIRKELQTARNYDVVVPFRNSLLMVLENGDPVKNVRFYAPPATYHRMTLGIHPINKYFKIKTIGTVMAAKEVIYNDGVKETIYDITKPDQDPVVKK